MAVSVTIPVFNEAAVIEKVVNDCHNEILAKIHDSELIIVNDGSTDATSMILERLRLKFGQLKIINLEKNSGHGKALRIAFDQASKALIFHVDGDNQFSIKEFWQLYQHIEGNDIVTGYRNHRYDTLHRKIVSLILEWVNAVLFGVQFRDANAPFKLIRSSVLKEIMRDVPYDYSPTAIILLILAQLKGHRITEVPVTHFERKTGKSKTQGFYLLKLCIVYLKDLLRLKCRIAGRLK